MIARTCAKPIVGGAMVLAAALAIVSLFGQTQQPVQRYGMVIGLKPEKVEYYKKLHAAALPAFHRVYQDSPCILVRPAGTRCRRIGSQGKASGRRRFGRHLSKPCAAEEPDSSTTDSSPLFYS